MPDKSLSFNVTALDNASKTFVKMAAQVDRLSQRIDRLDRKEADVKINVRDKEVYRKLDRIGHQTELTAKRSGNRVARALLNPVVIELAGLPAVAAASAAATGAAISGAAAAFGGIAVAAQASTVQVQDAYKSLGTYVAENTRKLSKNVQPYLLGIAGMAERAFNDVSDTLGHAFDLAGAKLQTLAGGMLNMTKNALPGLTLAAATSSAEVSGLAELLERTGAGVSEFFTNLATGGARAGEGLEYLGQLLQKLLSSSGTLIAQFSGAWASIGDEVVRVVNTLMDVVTEFTSGALAEFVSSFEVAANVINGALSAVEPFAQVLGSMVGTLLGVAAGWKLVAGSVSRVSGSFGKLRPANVTRRLDGLRSSGSRTGKAFTKLGGTFTRVASTMPVLGAGAIAVKAALDAWAPSADSLAEKLATGAMAMDEVRQKTRDVGTGLEWVNPITRLFGTSLDEVREKAYQLYSQMSPLERAEIDVTKAQQRLTDAQNTYGKDSPQAALAAEILGLEMDDLEQRQKDAERATESHTDAVIRQTQVMLDAVTGQLGRKQALLGLEQAQKRVNETTSEYGPESLEAREATLAYQQQLVTVVEATRKRALSQAEANGKTNADAIATMAANKEIMRLASTIGVQGNPALQSMIVNMDKSALAATGAKLDVDGAGQAVLTLPNGKELRFPNDAPQAKEDVNKLDEAVNNLTTTKTITFHAQYIGFLTDPAKQLAPGGGNLPLGNIVGGNALGNILQFASGGFMPGGVAKTVRPNTWRVIGDRATDDEAYIPINSSPRSQRLLQETARRMGYGLQLMAEGGLMSAGGTKATQPVGPDGTPLSPEQVAALDAAAKALSATLTSLLMPALTQARTETSAFGTQTVATQAQVVNAWSVITDAVLGSHATLNASQAQLQAAQASSWAAITSTVQSSVTSQNSAFGVLQTGMARVRDAMTATADWAGAQFRRMYEAAAAPTRDVLRNPFNAGLIAAWNKLDSEFGFGKPVAPVAVPFARGSEDHRAQIAGPGSWRVWAEPETGGEAYIPLSSAKRGRSTDILSSVAQRFGYGLMPMAAGGVIGKMTGIVQSMFPTARVTSGYRPGDPGFHGRGQAIDFVTANMVRAAGIMSQRFPNSLELIHNPGGSIDNGRPVPPSFWGPATWAGHRDHIHWAMAQGMKGAAGSGFWDPKKMVADAFAHAKGLVGEFRGRWPGNTMAAQGADLATHAVDAVSKHTVERIKKMMSSLGGGGGGRWMPVVLKALSMLGMPASWADETVAQIGIESGGNPLAINRWDSNAARGTPSKGLLQTIGPTFRAHMFPGHGDILAPLDNILAGLDYARDRYGSIPAIWPTRAGYDSGGLLRPGYTLAYNGTGKNEAVLTQGQMRALTSNEPQVVVNVYPQQGQSETEIATMVSRRVAFALRGA